MADQPINNSEAINPESETIAETVHPAEEVVDGSLAQEKSSPEGATVCLTLRFCRPCGLSRTPPVTIPGAHAG